MEYTTLNLMRLASTTSLPMADAPLLASGHLFIALVLLAVGTFLVALVLLLFLQQSATDTDFDEPEEPR